MKKALAAITLLLLSLAAPAQDKVKHGFNSVPYPVVGYSDDLGIQYGINYTLFDYGDGSIFPNYRHKAVVELSRYTRGQTGLKLTYQSAYLIPGIRVSAALAYNMNPMYHFYGFNGSATPFNRALDRKGGVAFYDFDRKFIRAVTNFQGPIVNGLDWAAGVNFLSYRIDRLNPKYGYDPDNSLYNRYVETGVIRPDEAEGGNVLEFNAGLVCDTRNATTIPSKGIWSELYFTVAPDVFRTGHDYTRLSAHFRHYVGIVDNDRLTFAYHLAYQGIISGDPPFYVLQNITSLIVNRTVNEGLGNKNTIRGTLYNRFIGKGYVWANFETRVKLFNFTLPTHLFSLQNQSFYIAANPFFDCGAIVSPYRLNAARGSQAYKDATKFHGSYGAGLKLVMNRNFVMSVEVARPLNRDDGHFGLIMGSNYLF
ncbi:MAG: BamA/TamA family outer membrane protein [Bacteroidales bacterium]|nr:BamA/TamA family outer membrane protein [Bacteroidales bacterium]